MVTEKKKPGGAGTPHGLIDIASGDSIETTANPRESRAHFSISIPARQASIGLAAGIAITAFSLGWFIAAREAACDCGVPAWDYASEVLP